jgi:hypothetical protein
MAIYPLPRTGDLEALVGRALVSVVGSEHQAQLHFDGDVTIAVEDGLEVDGRAVELWDASRDLSFLVGDHIARTEIDPSGDALRIVMASGVVLVVSARLDGYESFTIDGVPGLIVV